MFSEPLSLNITEKIKVANSGASTAVPLHSAVVEKFQRKGWKCHYVSPFCETPHILATDSSGYQMGVVVFKAFRGIVHIRLETPQNFLMTTWDVPFTGRISSDVILDALYRAIDVFETEEIPEPEEEEE